MIISNTKLIIAVMLFSASAAVASPINTLGCNSQNSDALMKQVSTAESRDKSPTWWNWFTSNESSQFHFFQLMELLHSNDDKVTSAKVMTADVNEHQT